METNAVARRANALLRAWIPASAALLAAGGGTGAYWYLSPADSATHDRTITRSIRLPPTNSSNSSQRPNPQPRSSRTPNNSLPPRSRNLSNPLPAPRRVPSGIATRPTRPPRSRSPANQKSPAAKVPMRIRCGVRQLPRNPASPTTIRLPALPLVRHFPLLATRWMLRLSRPSRSPPNNLRIPPLPLRNPRPQLPATIPSRRHRRVRPMHPPPEVLRLAMPVPRQSKPTRPMPGTPKSPLPTFPPRWTYGPPMQV